VRGGQDKIGRQEMAASIDDYEQTYQQAYKAYIQRNYEQAAALINQAVISLPNDPNTHLLRGHIYNVLQQYDTAREEYQKVLELTADPEISDFAKNGLENISQYEAQFSKVDEVSDYEEVNSPDITETLFTKEQESQDLGTINGKKDVKKIDDVSSQFDMPTDITVGPLISKSGENPFVLHQLDETNNGHAAELEFPHFLEEDIRGTAFQESKNDDNFVAPFSQSENHLSSTEQSFSEQSYEDLNSNFEDETLVIEEKATKTLLTDQQELSFEQNSYLSQDVEHLEEPREIQDYVSEEQDFKKTSNSRMYIEDSSSLDTDFSWQQQQRFSKSRNNHTNFDSDDSLSLKRFDSGFISQELSHDEDTSSLITENLSQSSNIEFLEDFDEFDDLGQIPGFDITGDSSFGDSQLHSNSRAIKESKILQSEASDYRDAELFSITGSQEAVPVFTQPPHVSKIEPQVSVEQGLLAPLENAPLEKKQWLVAGAVGIVSAIVVATVSFISANLSPPHQRESVRNTGWAMALAAGLSGFATTGLMGSVTVRQIRRTTKDLQAQFDAVRQGNLNVQATVYSEDEFGQLATGFNEMARVIFTTTNEATRKAQEMEESKENLQRQVIRLLDDVEGAARGDLTVQAEVTADVLGAVADAFNLTIQNLRDIVQQVKVAARDVTKGATNSETFARALSSDALRQAEELGLTLNSVQVMTDSIQRVAEAAREAEAVARDASAFALKGGDAVENTVAGILEIRETVAETTRKVKRLAESSQEISKIVALISQIASRTNLLALNASIEAARAGEAGRGFAIVADEVRQLADKSAKSLKEIEQIVMQIQSETGSVMTAMEEGTQQVIQGTRLAEEAKRSLENIIQVAKRIDILVRSITTDTVEQTETSRAVAQVMQSVELTAQDTSQEAQRVSGALQHLVGVSRDLIASVERFRVETAETTR
jgi:twitching motility protein PilJ